MMAEKDPAWHSEQSASDDRVAPAHSTHEFLESTHDFTLALRQASRHLCLHHGMCAGEHGLAILAMPYSTLHDNCFGEHQQQASKQASKQAFILSFRLAHWRKCASVHVPAYQRFRTTRKSRVTRCTPKPLQTTVQRAWPQGRPAP